MPIDSAPKPEMLEKADKTVAEFEMRFPTWRPWFSKVEREALVYLIADDTQRALRASEASVERLTEINTGLVRDFNAMLIANANEAGARESAEASVESLRKERDEAREEAAAMQKQLNEAMGRSERDHIRDSNRVAEVLAELEAARAEATKAERERCAKLVCQWCSSPTVPYEDGSSVDAAQYFTRFKDGTVRWTHALHWQSGGTSDVVCGASAIWSAPSSPTPPSEEPR